MELVISQSTIDGHKRSYLDFFEQNSDIDYLDTIINSITSGEFRFFVNLNHIRRFDSTLANDLVHRPKEHLFALRLAAEELVESRDPSHSKLLQHNPLQIGFEGSFGQNLVSPRSLTSSYLNSLVAVEGIVTKCSPQRPKLVRSVHYCPNTGKYSSKEYRDALALDLDIELNGAPRNPTPSVYPTHDAEENPLETEFGLCEFKDYQTITLQEMPERSTVGQLPRSVQVILEHDLVDQVKPGDRVRISGIFRALGSKNVEEGSSVTSGVFRTLLMATSITKLTGDLAALQLTGSDVKHIRELSSSSPSSILSLLAKSLCPSIFGHEFIKQALILQLLGGVEKDLDNGTHLRGDVNILLVGDPSTAKSQLLRAMLDVAPLAVSTSGRGSSGVGLTAAVTSDPETHERRLEAGAMVLADRGVVCIDEFDKMTEIDRVAIHEAMEQQTVTIAKAGLHASLNARCSVLAAANPIYGMYDRSKRPQENIGLPDSLLSRFDLVFVVLDHMDPVSDRRIASHILTSHRYRRSGLEASSDNSSIFADQGTDEIQEGNDQTSRVWLRKTQDSTTTPGKSSSSSSSLGTRQSLRKQQKQGKKNNNTKDELLTKSFLKKYIHYAKQRFSPVLTDEARELISQTFSEMRVKSEGRNLPVTARSLETLIRLSTAHAKARLSMQVEECDVEAVSELLNYVLYHEVGIRSSFASQSSMDHSNDNNDDDDDEEALNALQEGLQSSSSSNGKRSSYEREEKERSSSSRKKQRKQHHLSDSDNESEEQFSLEEEDEEEEEYHLTTPLRPPSSSSSLLLPDGTADRHHHLYVRATQLISSLGSSFHASELKSKLPSSINDKEVEAILKTLQTENRIFYSEEDGMVDLI